VSADKKQAVPQDAASNASQADGTEQEQAAGAEPEQHDGSEQQADGSEQQQRDGESENRSLIAGVASTIAGGASTIAGGAGSVISGAIRLIGERPGARVRRVRRMGHEPLVNLWDVHPEARRASIRELGLMSVPVDAIRGTAVEGPPQRGGDFLPLKDRRSEDWRGRWQRILRALDQLETLPPVELIKFGDDYWVVDGHNRVAAALYNGQLELDAVVEELRLPGMKPQPTPLIASVLEGSLDLRAAGSGRLTRTAQRPTDLESASRDRHVHDVDEPTDVSSAADGQDVRDEPQPDPDERS